MLAADDYVRVLELIEKHFGSHVDLQMPPELQQRVRDDLIILDAVEVATRSKKRHRNI